MDILEANKTDDYRTCPACLGQVPAQMAICPFCRRNEAVFDGIAIGVKWALILGGGLIIFFAILTILS